ncbi:MAG: energy transducer TonB [bacterium]
MNSILNNYGSLFRKTIVFSAIVHLLFLFVLMYGNLIPSSSINYTPVYTVKLVSTSALNSNQASSEAENKKTLPSNTQTPAVEQKAVEHPRQMILPIEKKPVSKKELLSAINAVNNELRKQQLLNAIKQAVKNANSSNNSTNGQGGAVASGNTGLPSGSIADEYYSVIWQKIHDAWLVPSSMAASSYGYETIVSITINRDGSISNLSVEKSSGNVYFDQTAIRAIKRASPLPPFPPSWLQKSINIGIKFSCKEGCQ